MPTGYTAKIYENKPISFEDFALECARAFGACIMQREENSDVKPKLNEESNYHSEALDKAKKELDEFLNTKRTKLALDFAEDQQKSIKDANDSIKKITEMRKRYEKMIVEVEKWIPPTKDHVNLKSFM